MIILDLFDTHHEKALKEGAAENSLNELSKNTLKSYSRERGTTIHQDQRDADRARDTAADKKKHGNTKAASDWNDEARWLDKRAEKGAKGVAQAAIKIAKKGVAEGGPYDLPGKDYDRPGDMPRKQSSKDHNPYPYSPEEDDDYFRKIFRKKREADKAKAQSGSLNELSNKKLGSYKTAAGADATAADKRGDYKRGDKRVKGIINATKKEFANDAKKHKDVAEGSELSTSTLTGEIPTSMGHRKKEQRDLIEKYALHNREQDYFELFVELSGKPMSEIYNMNDSHRLANELYNLGSQIASDWRNISNPTFSRREYLNQIMSDWYNLFKKSIQKYKSMAQGVAEVKEESSTASEAVERAILNRIMVAHTDLLMKFGPDKVMQAAEEVAYNAGDVDEIGTSDVSAYVRQVRQILGAE